MMDFPSPVIDYIHTLTTEKYAPGYLFLEKDGRLSSWGGNLAAYGVIELKKGEYVGEKVLFLEGIFPLDGADLFLPCMKTKEGVSADVHIFTGNDGDWVLLLDATVEEHQRHLFQQKGNDLSLLREKHARILNQYLVKEATEHLVQKLLTLQVRGERRDVTVLFADIYGFTSYSENHNPEAVVKTLNLYLASMIQPIIDEAGLVDKIVGDAITACFGVLPSTGCHQSQAVKAALQTIEAVKDISIQQDDDHTSLNLRIGIASGSVVLGIIGSKERRTFSAIGYYVNLAADLKSEARPNEILIDENTFKKIDNMQEQFSETTFFPKKMVEPVRIYSCLVK